MNATWFLVNSKDQFPADFADLLADFADFLCDMCSQK